MPGFYIPGRTSLVFLFTWSEKNESFICGRKGNPIWTNGIAKFDYRAYVHSKLIPR